MFCPKCGKEIDDEVVVCPSCGKQVKNLDSSAATAAPTVINIENTNKNTNTNAVPVGVKAKKKLTAILLCIFLGALGAHRFYEGKIGTGILWLFTAGLFGIGVIVDFFILLFKPSTYYVA